MNDFHIFRGKVKELVKAWNKVIKPGIEESGQYGETNTRKYLIDPILEALNWVDDGSKKIVDNEFAIKHKTGTGSADYALKINDVPKILLEAKDVAKVKDLENSYDMIHGIKRTYPRQLSNYCHDLNHLSFDIKFAILTNGKEWIIYNMQYADISSEREVVFRLDLEEMDKPENLQKLWALEYNDFVAGCNRLREIIQQLHDYRLDIDKKAVQKLLECKDLLSSSILNDYEKDKRGIKSQIDNILSDKEKDNGIPTFQEISEEERFNFFIKEASSSIINKVLFIRILEDKNFLTPKLTKRSIEKWKDFWGHKDYREIMNLFREACRVTENTYNGGLFRLNPYDKVEYDPDAIKKIIDILGDINFREIDSDIIGRIYEIYLGQVLKVEAEIRGKKRTKYKADNKERKKLGQYYTPKFVVDFIVKNTLGKLIEGKKPEDVKKLRILDPACGSGSFLINAYDTLVEYYEDWNNGVLKRINEDNKKKGAELTRYQSNGSVLNYKNIILKENIHGVDLNSLSVQIAEINLWIRALERNKKLIKLNKNILHGNSLVTGVEGDEELTHYKAELEEIKQRTNEIKDYYDKDELDYGEKNKLKALEARLKVLKEKINTKLNENLKGYFGDNFNKVQAFNWEVEFPQIMQEGGFDVVIGNPPYFDIRTLPSIFQNYFKLDPFWKEVHTRQADILYYFIINGIKKLKKGGLLGFIVGRYWLEATDGNKLRKFILDNCKIRLLIDFRDISIFEDANVHTSIIIVEKNSNNKDNVFDVCTINSKQLEGKTPKDFMFDKPLSSKLFFKKKQSELDENNWVLLGDVTDKVFRKILSQGEKLNKVFHVGTGIQTGRDSVFVVDEETIEKENIEKGVLKKWIKNGQILRYFILPSSEFVINGRIDFEIKPFKNAISYLNKNKKRLVDRYEYIKEKCGLYQWSTVREIGLFDIKKKILTPYKSGTNRFYLSNDELYFSKDVYQLIKLKSTKEAYEFLLGLLNSKLLKYFFLNYGKKMGKIREFYATPLLNIPIKRIDFNDKKEVKFHDELHEKVKQIIELFNRKSGIYFNFNQSLSNQPISDPKSCKLAHYFDNYELYGMQRETSGRINEIKTRILSLTVKEEWDKLVIYMTDYNEEQKQLRKNIKALTLNIKDENVRKFLFFSIKKYINEKKGRGFGSGNILELIKKIEVPVYATNVKINLDKINQVMKEFNHETKDLWKIDNKTYKTLTEIQEDIKKIDEEIDEMVYDLYGITEKEKKIIEESLK